MKKKIINSCLILSLALGACEAWVDIKPTDRLSEEVLFTSKEGFLKALNGVYIELAHPDLYGMNLSAGPLDVMGQYYTFSGSSSHRLYYFSNYTYTNANVKTVFDNAWKKAYALIFNCNVILEKCGEGHPLLPNPHFGLVKGEALALRAMLHLDLFRLFGPIWSDESKGNACIPYMTLADQQIRPLLPAQTVRDSIIRDLKEALSLLKESDPIRAEGVRNESSPTGNNDLFYRQYRLNYYAVKALLARTYLWCGDKVNALALAKEILEEVQVPGNEIFPFVSPADASNVTIPDRLFSSEVMFALYKTNRVNVYNTLFAPTLDMYNLLTFAGAYASGRVNELYDDKNDYRYKIWANHTVDASVILYHEKFKDITPNAAGFGNGFRYMMPLIQLSELYLMAAECSTSLDEGIGYLNQVRNNRNCFSVTPASSEGLLSAIALELKKEMIGEGQLFFFYKRQGMQVIPNGSLPSGTMNMSLNNYVVPLPDSEISERMD
ncbi:MAG: RagB/SusD family nutrient uptake outer membrane protein [Odoribacteraceae bacterium]|jgi:hypothetical protein|nr:RagB/SusD family nutrient uptake outer membrane protein [Odoribacteraceae bacterium]